MAIHAVAAGRGTVTHASSQVQKYPRVQYLPLLSASRAPQTLQSLLLIGGKN